MNADDVLGRKLQAVRIVGDNIEMVVDNALMLLVAQGDCCAHAYFTDLELCKLPATILGWKNAAGESTNDDDGDCLDAEFVTVTTDRGRVDFTLHTSHNGYYGGWYDIRPPRNRRCTECNSRCRFDDGWWLCEGCGGAFDAD